HRMLGSRRLGERYGAAAPWLALGVALVWLVHPLQTESVTYVIQRAEALMGLFFLLTLYCAARGFESRQAGFWYFGAIVACGLGMASKEVMLSAPVLVLLYDRLFVTRSVRESLETRWAFYAGLAATWMVLVI